MSTEEVNQFLVDLRSAIRTLEQLDIPTIAGAIFYSSETSSYPK
jgi:hypothetical protein